mmetsp:Transcript_7170/g.22944  ORF Transcript_7170/g.22944 Transcript_7170/m.22944 type:complete len:455 (-) Transcript_7170:80-1444(-)
MSFWCPQEEVPEVAQKAFKMTARFCELSTWNCLLVQFVTSGSDMKEIERQLREAPPNDKLKFNVKSGIVKELKKLFESTLKACQVAKGNAEAIGPFPRNDEYTTEIVNFMNKLANGAFRASDFFTVQNTDDDAATLEIQTGKFPFWPLHEGDVYMEATGSNSVAHEVAPTFQDLLACARMADEARTSALNLILKHPESTFRDKESLCLIQLFSLAVGALTYCGRPDGTDEKKNSHNIAAIAVSSNDGEHKIVTQAFNKSATDAGDYKEHAETRLLCGLPEDCGDIAVFVTLQPCFSCSGSLAFASSMGHRVADVYYLFDDTVNRREVGGKTKEPMYDAFSALSLGGKLALLRGRAPLCWNLGNFGTLSNLRPPPEMKKRTMNQWLSDEGGVGLLKLYAKRLFSFECGCGGAHDKVVQSARQAILFPDRDGCDDRSVDDVLQAASEYWRGVRFAP